MRETWVHPNRRAVYFALLPPAVLLVIGTALLLGVPGEGWLWAVRIGGGLLAALSGLAIGGLLYLSRLPRLAYQDGFLLVFLGPLNPFRVPIDIVECFFVGQGPSLLPEVNGTESEASTVIVRLAESALEWHHQDGINPKLGHWCEGYITIRGTWCEPVTKDLMRRLNARLVEVHRERKAAAKETV